MKSLRYLRFKNKGAFVAKMRVKYSHSSGDGEYKLSGDMPVNIERTIDLKNAQIPEGAKVWLKVDVVAGKGKESGKNEFEFNENANLLASYEITGTTLINKLKKKKEIPVPLAVRYIKLKNTSASVAQMRIKYVHDTGSGEFKPDSYHDVLVKGERTIDLTETGIPNGAIINLKVIVVGGRDNEAAEKLKFDETNADTATYEIYGTTGHNSLIIL